VNGSRPPRPRAGPRTDAAGAGPAGPAPADASEGQLFGTGIFQTLRPNVAA
jgi:hypothetical protein